MAGQHEPELIRRAKAGDALAYEDLRRPALAPAARLAAVLIGGNTAEAEDAVQEAAVRAWRRIGNLREDALFEPWFLGIVVRQVRTLQAERWWGVVRLPEIIGGRSHPGDSGSKVRISGEPSPGFHAARERRSSCTSTSTCALETSATRLV